jgi:hypothetical protein
MSGKSDTIVAIKVPVVRIPTPWGYAALHPGYYEKLRWSKHYSLKGNLIRARGETPGIKAPEVGTLKECFFIAVVRVLHERMALDHHF